MTVTLELRERPRHRVDLAGVCPGRLQGLSAQAIAALALHDGGRRVRLGDLFTVRGEDPSELVIANACTRLDGIGAGMDGGRIRVEGDAGAWLGLGMRAGEIRLSGDCGDFAAAGMHGGTLRIGGSAGQFLGSAAPGERRGMRGGTVLVAGNAGARLGDRQRRGIIVVEGDAGAGCAARMLAGTILVLGRAGPGPGCAMLRGSLLLAQPPAALSATFNDSGVQELRFLHLLAQHLAGLGCRRADEHLREARARRYVGDLACAGKGEILLLGGG